MHKETRFHYEKQLQSVQTALRSNKPVKRNPFFEGWYYKCSSKEVGNIAVIFGVASAKGIQQSFIQLVHHTNIQGYYTFPITDFSVKNEPFLVRVGDSEFRETSAQVRLPHVTLHMTFSRIEPLPSTFFFPSIMGPLMYIRYLPCFHHIMAMRADCSGTLAVKKDDNWSSQMFHGIGYQEKDYGISFPSGYSWCHASSADASISLAVAMVPYVRKDRIGFFAILQKGDQILRFSTYQLGKIKHFSHYQSKIYIELEQQLTQISISIEYMESCQLKAPKSGQMNAVVEESLDCKVRVTAEKKGKLLYDEEFMNGTSEVFEYANIHVKQKK